MNKNAIDLLLFIIIFLIPQLCHAIDHGNEHVLTEVGQNDLTGLNAYLAEKFELIPANETEVNSFGASISMSLNRVLIGASQDMVNGLPAGSAYVFEYDGMQWRQMQKLIASDGKAFAGFGDTVSIHGDWALVGSYGLGSAASDNGSVHVFRFDGTNWLEEAKLTAKNSGRNDQYGKAISMTDSHIFVGAYRDDENGFDAGAVFVYELINGVWVETQKLLASDGLAVDFFGHSVSVSGDVALIGAQGVDDQGDFAGAAYVFNYDGLAWNEVQKLNADDAERSDGFGFSVSISGSRAILGSLRGDGLEENSGAAYIFHFTNNEWRQTQKLIADDAVQQTFGKVVGLSGNRALISSYGYDSESEQHVVAYVFKLSGDNWVQEHKLGTSENANLFIRASTISGNESMIGGVGKIYAYDLNGTGQQLGSITPVFVLGKSALLMMFLLFLFVVVSNTKIRSYLK